MKKLFMSHASEDKPFVRLLAEALRSKGFEVWLDEWVITLGDSLRQKIDEGLSKADFGVVIISKHFMAKDWTNRELNGLFALETKHRKVILPIWHEVTRDEVVNFSPTLADKFAVPSSHGLDAVVDAIMAAVSSSDRTREVIVKGAGEQALDELVDGITSAKNERLRFKSLGVSRPLITRSAETVSDLIKKKVEQSGKKSPTPLFEVKPGVGHAFTIWGPYGVFAYCAFHDIVTNDASQARYSIDFGHGVIGPFGQLQGKPSLLEKMEFWPRLPRDGEVLWELPPNRCNEDELADSVVKTFASHIAQRRGR